MLNYIAAICLIFLGLLLKYSSQDEYSPLKKYGFFFVVAGAGSLLYKLCWKLLDGIYCRQKGYILGRGQICYESLRKLSKNGVSG